MQFALCGALVVESDHGSLRRALAVSVIVVSEYFVIRATIGAEAVKIDDFLARSHTFVGNWVLELSSGALVGTGAILVCVLFADTEVHVFDRRFIETVYCWEKVRLLILGSLTLRAVLIDTHPSPTVVFVVKLDVVLVSTPRVVGTDALVIAEY